MGNYFSLNNNWTWTPYNNTFLNMPYFNFTIGGTSSSSSNSYESFEDYQKRIKEEVEAEQKKREANVKLYELKLEKEEIIAPLQKNIEDIKTTKNQIETSKNKDGSSVEYHYENDINGNKFLTSVKQNEAENKAPKDFNGALEQSTLGAKFQTPEDLEAQGWVKEPYMDKNGGIYYKNPETGATIRVMESRLFGEGKTLTLKTGNMSHFVEYDNNGNETGGTVQVKLDDNTIKVYDYSVDINGNKFIRSEEIVHQDYLSDYE